jgi:ribokinase
MRRRKSSNELVLTHTLEKLRRRDGLTLTRLEAGADEVAAPLLSLASVQRYASIHHVELARAALAVVAQCVQEALVGTDRIVADAVLALGTLDAHYRQDVEPRAVAALRSHLLSRRRKTLLTYWRRLHEALGVAPVDTPSDRTLRGVHEPQALAELAHQLIRREIHSLGSESAVTPRTGHFPAKATLQRAGGRVIVVGGAVMDATFQTKALPAREMTNEAHGFDLSPGGKGLTQAVAAARLGLDVSLLAALTDDHFGQEIFEYLQHEGVDTSMLKFVSDARTPFTGVIEFELGDSIAFNWRNEREVRLDIRDVEQFKPQLLESDAVLITFELTRETMHGTLDLIHNPHMRRPLKIVTPGHPYSDGGVSSQALAKIDYLVAHAWELGRYAPPNQGTFDLDAVARRVMAYGVETLCVPTGGGCTIYSETALGTFTVPTFPSAYKESQAARDAFCAALAAKLIDGQGEFSEEVALWATAAMAAATADYPLPNSMPDRPRVERLLSRSRFTVAPRVDVEGAGDGETP